MQFGTLSVKTRVEGGITIWLLFVLSVTAKQWLLMDIIDMGGKKGDSGSVWLVGV